MGFFLTMSYKSVLRAMMMNVYYEQTIDTIDDMLESERTLMVAGDSIIPLLLASDPRLKAIELEERAQFYRYGTGQENEFQRVNEG